MKDLHTVILAGGRGKRFWPFSSAGRPKQFLDITGEGSMLSLTYARLRRFVSSDRMLVLSERNCSLVTDPGALAMASARSASLGTRCLLITETVPNVSRPATRRTSAGLRTVSSRASMAWASPAPSSRPIARPASA